MPSQLVPPRSQVMLSNSRHYMKDSLSLFHPCSQGSRGAANLETLALKFNLAIFVIHSHVFIHHDQSLP